jgi:hypothetical protein
LELLDFGWADRASGTGTRCSPAKAGKPAAGFLQIKDCLSISTSELTKISLHLYFQMVKAITDRVQEKKCNY